MPMDYNHTRILLLIVTMTMVALGSGGAAIFMLYHTAFEQESLRLVETAQSQARLLEAVARFDRAHHAEFGGYHEDPTTSTLSQIRDAHRHYHGFGETGEFTLAQREGDNILFLLRHRHSDLDVPQPVLFTSALAEPMRRALQGRAGVGVLPDYRGVKVLAAYEPVAVLDMGIVAKIDLTEIQAPFLRTAGIALMVTGLLVTVGTGLFYVISTPLLQQLQRSEQEFRAVFEQAAVGICYADLNGRFLQVNRKLCEIFGYTEAELLNMSGQDISDPEDLETDLAHGRDLLAGHTSAYHMEKRYIRKDGGRLWGDLTVSLLHKADGTPSCFIGVVEDISRRKQAEATLAKERRQLFDVLDSLPMAIYLQAPDYSMRFVNRYFREVFGEPEGRLCYEVFAGRQAPCEPCPTFEVFKTRTLVVWEWRSPDNRYYRVYDTPFPARDGEEYVLETLIDVSALKKAEAELQKYSVSLETQVAQRTQALQEANLHLRELSRIKDEFLATMSHELRTPLNTMLSICGALQEQAFGPLTPKQLHYLENQEKSATHLLSLINDILDIAKIGADKLEPVFEALSPLVLCQSIRSLIEPALQRKNFSLETDFDPDVDCIQADPHRLKQILLNLLGNAIKFTPAGGRIGLRYTGNRDSRQVCFEVWDTGIGIDPAVQDKIFEPFVQADSRLARQYEGSGLGLTLVKNLVKLHGGQVRVTSRANEGSCFTVCLPWKDEED